MRWPWEGGRRKEARMDISAKELARHLSIQSPMPCAQCGGTLYTPEWSEHVDDCRVRHFWICEACDYKFETLVKFPRLSSALID
jgi:hypothetical protein